MSTLKVNTITTRTGDTVTVASGKTLQTDTIKDNSNNTLISSDGTNIALGANVAPGRSPSFRNILINGDMSIAQRGTSTASITSSGYYTVDRFQFVNNNQGTWTMSQDTDVPTGQGFAKSLKLDCTTADAAPAASDYLQYNYKIEGQMLQYLKKGTSSAESLTLSFWVKSNKTGTYIAEFFDNDNARANSQSYTVNSANTWEKKTITIPGDTTGAFDNDNNASLFLVLWLGGGTDFTSGTLNTSWNSRVNTNTAVGQVNLADAVNNQFYITGVQLEAGTQASPFEFLPYDVNLNRCYRYFEKESTNSNGIICVSQAYSTSAALGYKQYKVIKRTAPSISFTGTAIALTAGAASAGGTLTFADISVDNCRANIASATGLVAGNASAILANTAITISYDSEL